MSQIAFTNYDIPGAFEPFPKPSTSQQNKKFTTDASLTTYDLQRGWLLAHDPDDTTPSDLVVAEADSERPFYMAYGYALKQRTGQTYILQDSAFDILAALHTDPQVPVLEVGVATMYIDGIVNPGDFVMPSDGTTSHSTVTGVLGHVQKWDGSNRKTIAGVYKGLIGQSGGKYRKTPTLNLTGQLGKVHLNAPGAA